MRMSRRAVGAGMLAAVAAPGARAQPAWVAPDNGAIDRILAERIDTLRQGVGIVVGVIDAKGRRVVSHGVAARAPHSRPLDGGTVFEIGSMTKVFTSLLLADAVRRGEVRLDDPVAKYAPAGARMPERGGRQITLIDLATHTSGLPRMPDNFKPANPENPYADYDAAKLYAYLSGYALTRDIGAQYEYSNLGAGLLGDVLAREAGMTYEALLRRRILEPLKMRDTTIALTAPLKARLAAGHTATLAPAANWDLDALAGAGAIRSTADDLLTFLAAELRYAPSPLAGAMADQLVPRRKGPAPVDMALGWHVSSGEVYWHNGGTGGYRSFFGFDPKSRIGVVVLTNAATVAGGDDIGFHILAGRPLSKLQPAPPPRVAIALPSAAIAPFVGVYHLASAMKMEVSQEGARLFAQLTGQARYEIFPEGPNDFFWKVVDAQVTFERDPAGGPVTRAVVHQMGRDTTWTRANP
ncbi:MAG: serine hydrolase [Phenylobacterium sp.]|uniref:serine hydrolase n=1 Tax=Phenylobacterium sp. TaxID=1871053 RepID=UPI001A56D7E4|nr:serine hydrolase [Phenylobacterium sp.]MBL8553007.1 serine hydrolase [Phenylobacterium sp.]